MPRSPARRLRDFALVRDDHAALHRQVYEHIRNAIRTGQLRPGERYLVRRGAAGTAVNTDLDGRAIAGAASRPRVASPAVPPAVHVPRPFQMGLPALDAFPRKAWSRLVARHAR